MKKKIYILIGMVLAIGIGSYIFTNYILNTVIDIEYIGEVEHSVEEYSCYVRQIDAALTREFLFNNQDLVRRIKELDKTKVKLIFSNGAPLKKLTRDNEIHYMNPEYDKSKGVQAKTYLYIMDINIDIHSTDV